MSDGSITHGKLAEWLFLAAGWAAAAATALWRRAQTERDWLTVSKADTLYLQRGDAYTKDQSDSRFANKESCAIQHKFLSERFIELNDRISTEAEATRALIEALHGRR